MTDETEDERLLRLMHDRVERPLPRRFYKTVQVSDANAILLDGRVVKTPLKAQLVLPARALAEAVAAEWDAQEKHINPALMPVTKLANTAIDRATAERDHILREIVGYAGSDLVCYWAEGPEALVARQRAHWQPVVDWAENHLDARFNVARGITHVAQPPEALAKVHAHADSRDNWQLTTLYLLTTLTGSALLALRYLQDDLDAAALWAAAHVDEDYQIEQWGEDWEATKRRDSRRREFDGLIAFHGHLRGR